MAVTLCITLAHGRKHCGGKGFMLSVVSISWQMMTCDLGRQRRGKAALALLVEGDIFLLSRRMKRRVG